VGRGVALQQRCSLMVTTPTGSPAALLHLITSVVALCGAVAFTALHFERQEY
jgi:hypothetical protein